MSCRAAGNSPNSVLGWNDAPGCNEGMMPRGLMMPRFFASHSGLLLGRGANIHSAQISTSGIPLIKNTRACIRAAGFFCILALILATNSACRNTRDYRYIATKGYLCVARDIGGQIQHRRQQMATHRRFQSWTRSFRRRRRPPTYLEYNT